jgi:transposase InsO family protein
MVKILRAADVAPMAELARKHGISDPTIYLWRKRFGKLEPSDMKRLRQLEQENAKLKKLVAERDLEIEVLAKLISVHGAPGYLRSDNGPEFVLRAIPRWFTSANIETAAIDPGKPWQNGLNESFNGRFRDECQAMQWCMNRFDAKILIDEFRHGYNEVRPQLSLGQLTPVEFKQRVSTIYPERAIF